MSMSSMRSTVKTIAIIGGGFSGTLAAVNLARFSELSLHRMPHQPRTSRGSRRSLPARGESNICSTSRRGHVRRWPITPTTSSIGCGPVRNTPICLSRNCEKRSFRAKSTATISVDYCCGIRNRSKAVEACRSRPSTMKRWTSCHMGSGRGRVLLAGGANRGRQSAALATGNQPPADLPSGPQRSIIHATSKVLGRVGKPSARPWRADRAAGRGPDDGRRLSDA